MTQGSKARMRQRFRTLSAALFSLFFSAASEAALKDGLVAYWPLDEVVGTKTPELVNGYDMELSNLTAADLVDGKAGKAFKFDSARQTLLRRINSPGEQLPINQFPAFTVAFWANVVGTGQNDLRLFSEGNTANNDPLFNLGTASAGGSGQLDVFLRHAPWPVVGHILTEGEPLDGTWHHIAFVQQADGSRAVYLDGVRDPLEIAPKPQGSWNLNTTTIGGILRANPTHFITGTIDDVALWNRALTELELTSVVKDGTPAPAAKPLPLAIRSFTSDLPAVAVGDAVTLRWDVTKGVQVSIDNGVGDVTAKTIAGLGSVEAPLSATRTFKLTLTRGAETVSQSVTVAAIPGVSEGWTLIENFDRYAPGLLNGKGGWLDLDSADFEIVQRDGNLLAAPNSAEGAAFLRLGPLSMTPGQRRTLFFRAVVTDEGEPVRGQVALTDRNIRFGNEVGNDIGPGAILSNELEGGVLTGGYNGYQAPVELFEPVLEPNAVYNIWVDIFNGPFPADQSSTGDLYSVHVQKDGAAQRATVIADYTGARNIVGSIELGAAGPNLDKLVLGGLAGHSTAKNLLIDDLYLSKTGFNATTPRAFGFTTPVSGEPPKLAIQKTGGQIEISWTAGVLESSASVNSGWAPVAGAASPHRIQPDGAQRFYRTRE